MKCKTCNEVHEVIFPRLVPVPQDLFKAQTTRNPKYTVMLHAICPLCLQSLGFIKQNDESIAEANRQWKAHELNFKTKTKMLLTSLPTRTIL